METEANEASGANKLSLANMKQLKLLNSWYYRKCNWLPWIKFLFLHCACSSIPYAYVPFFSESSLACPNVRYYFSGPELSKPSHSSPGKYNLFIGLRYPVLFQAVNDNSKTVPRDFNDTSLELNLATDHVVKLKEKNGDLKYKCYIKQVVKLHERAS